jgi:hypothetical protein
MALLCCVIRRGEFYARFADRHDGLSTVVDTSFSGVVSPLDFSGSNL